MHAQHVKLYYNETDALQTTAYRESECMLVKVSPEGTSENYKVHGSPGSRDFE